LHPGRPSARARRGLTLCAIAALLALALPQAARAQADPEPVTLQLKWRHQFQFAGYYAAVTQGYYAEEGLEVSIVEGTAERAPLASVLQGRAQYGVTGADVLEAHLGGQGVVVLAPIFQHSPYVLLTRLDSGIVTPADLVGRRVMLAAGQGETEFQAMLLRQGIAPSSIERVEHTWNNRDLIDGRVAAMSAYVSVEPIQIRREGVEVSLLRPIDYGVDFYGDTLFTTRAELAAHPERVRAMRRASLRGWEYALAHVEPMIRLILALPGARQRGLTVDHLRFEAERMRELILPDLFAIGHSNPRRWQRMAEVYASLGLAPREASLEGFLFDPDPQPDPTWRRVALGAAAALLLFVGLASLWTWQLRSLVRQRTEELQRSERQLEQRVRERTAELEAANRELEAFSYSVSHDLRAPLRHMAGFSRILIEDYGDRLDESARAHLDRIAAAAGEMAQITDGLLTLSRLSGSEMRWETVDLSALAEAIAADLQRSAPERRAIFDIAPGLTARGDARLLRQLLQNLLDNAWKYSAPHASTHIELGARSEGGEVVFHLRDDGIGFDAADAERVFTPFRRLPGAAAFEGTGIGLATVQRIVRRHGGRIWAEAAPDEGATFYFTLAPAGTALGS